MFELNAEYASCFGDSEKYCVNLFLFSGGSPHFNPAKVATQQSLRRNRNLGGTSSATTGGSEWDRFLPI